MCHETGRIWGVVQLQSVRHEEQDGTDQEKEEDEQEEVDIGKCTVPVSHLLLRKERERTPLILQEYTSFFM